MQANKNQQGEIITRAVVVGKLIRYFRARGLGASGMISDRRHGDAGWWELPIGGDGGKRLNCEAVKPRGYPLAANKRIVHS